MRPRHNPRAGPSPSRKCSRFSGTSRQNQSNRSQARARSTKSLVRRIADHHQSIGQARSNQPRESSPGQSRFRTRPEFFGPAQPALFHTGLSTPVLRAASPVSQVLPCLQVFLDIDHGFESTRSSSDSCPPGLFFSSRSGGPQAGLHAGHAGWGSLARRPCSATIPTTLHALSCRSRATLQGRFARPLTVDASDR